MLQQIDIDQLLIVIDNATILTPERRQELQDGLKRHWIKYNKLKAENYGLRTAPQATLNVSITTNNPTDSWTMNVPEQATFPVDKVEGENNVNE